MSNNAFILFIAYLIADGETTVDDIAQAGFYVYAAGATFVLIIGAIAAAIKLWAHLKGRDD